MPNMKAMQISAPGGDFELIEVFPLEKAAEAYEKMMNGTVKFRSVLKMGK